MVGFQKLNALMEFAKQKIFTGESFSDKNINETPNSGFFKDNFITCEAEIEV